MKTPLRLVAILIAVPIWAGALAGCGNDEPGSIAEWVALLDHEDVNERYRAATALSERGADAVPALIERLAKDATGSAERPPDEGDDDPRQIVANTLVLIGEPAVPALIEALALEEELERRLAARALQRIGVADAHLPRLVELLDDENPMIAGLAGGLLVEEQQGRLHLQSILADDTSSILLRTRAIRALVTLDDADALQSIVDAVGAKESPVRLEAVKALNALSTLVNAAEALVPLLDDEDEQIRLWTSTALRGQKDAAVDALARVLAEGSPRARSLAAGVLSALGPKALAAAPALASNLEHGDALVRVRAASALYAIAEETERTLPVLVAAALGDDPWARLEAVTALAGFADSAEEVVPVLLKALRSDDADVARRAARSLGSFEGNEVIEALKRAALSDDDVLRENAERSLEAIKGSAK